MVSFDCNLTDVLAIFDRRIFLKLYCFHHITLGSFRLAPWIDPGIFLDALQLEIVSQSPSKKLLHVNAKRKYLIYGALVVKKLIWFIYMHGRASFKQAGQL